MTERDDALGERLGEALAEARREPEVGFERRAREGAEARRSARRARRAAVTALALATAAGAAIWVLDRPGSVPLWREPATPAVGPTVEPLSPEEADRIVAELADLDKAMQVSADWERATAAAGPGPGPGPGPSAKKRGLTPAQQQQLRDIEAEAEKEKVRARAEIDVLEIDLQRELQRDAPDEKKVGELIEKLAAAEGRARKAQVLAALRVKKLTGAEPQKVRLKEPFPEAKETAEQRAMEEAEYQATLVAAKQAYGERQWSRALIKAEDALEIRPGPEAMALATMAACKLRNSDIANKYLRRLQGQRLHMARQICLAEKVPLQFDFSGKPANGTLTINTRPFTRVFVDGMDTGKSTPIMNLELKPGRHRLTLINEAQGIHHTRDITVEPGQDQKVVMDLDNKTLE